MKDGDCENVPRSADPANGVGRMFDERLRRTSFTSGSRVSKKSHFLEGGLESRS